MIISIGAIIRVGCGSIVDVFFFYIFKRVWAVNNANIIIIIIRVIRVMNFFFQVWPSFPKYYKSNFFCPEKNRKQRIIIMPMGVVFFGVIATLAVSVTMTCRKCSKSTSRMKKKSELFCIDI